MDHVVAMCYAECVSVCLTWASEQKSSSKTVTGLWDKPGLSSLTVWLGTAKAVTSLCMPAYFLAQEDSKHAHSIFTSCDMQMQPLQSPCEMCLLSLAQHNGNDACPVNTCSYESHESLNMACSVRFATQSEIMRQQCEWMSGESECVTISCEPAGWSYFSR